MKFIVEHLEPELFEWCIIEYRHIAKIVGADNVLFTNIRYKKDCDRLRGFAKAEVGSFAAMDLGKVCVLDPAAEKTLQPLEAKDFACLVFGGILGNYPMQARTKAMIPRGFERRNLGKEQMATDNAVYTAKEIIRGKKLSEISFQVGVSIDIQEGEAVDLPFKYVLVGGKPLLSPPLVKYLKKHNGF